MKSIIRPLGVSLVLGCATAALAQSTGPKIDRVDIKFVGPASVSEEFIRANIKLKSGTVYLPGLTQDDVHELYSTGQFYNIRVSAEPAADGGVVLTYIVQVRPRITDIKIEGNKIVALKCVTMNEDFFRGHFPGHPIMPGVLQLEAIAQVAGIVLMKQGENKNQLAYFMSAEDVKWRKPVVPGDVLVIEIELTKARGKIGKAKGICKVAGEIVSEANVTFMLRDAEIS